MRRSAPPGRRHALVSRRWLRTSLTGRCSITARLVAMSNLWNECCRSPRTSSCSKLGDFNCGTFGSIPRLVSDTTPRRRRCSIHELKAPQPTSIRRGGGRPLSWRATRLDRRRVPKRSSMFNYFCVLAAADREESTASPYGIAWCNSCRSNDNFG